MKYIIAICTCLLVFGCVGQQQEAKVASKPINEDVQSGTSLYLDDSAQILTAESIDGKILWSVDVIKECGIPAVGDPKVRNVTIQDEKVDLEIDDTHFYFNLHEISFSREPASAETVPEKHGS